MKTKILLLSGLLVLALPSLASSPMKTAEMTAVQALASLSDNKADTKATTEKQQSKKKKKAQETKRFKSYPR